MFINMTHNPCACGLSLAMAILVTGGSMSYWVLLGLTRS